MRPFRLPVLLIAAVLLVLCRDPATAEERRVALVIAAERYAALRPLATPLADAVAIADLLSTLGFEVTVETDRTARQLRRAVDGFAEDAAGAGLALVYYAGHGVEIGGENLLLPVDSRADSATALSEGALPLNEVVEAVRAVVPAVVVIVDACREDPFGTEGAARDGARSARPIEGDLPEGVSGGFARVGRAEGIFFAFSTAPGALASDGSGAHSPFAGALLRHLAVPGQPLPVALTLVQQDVYDRSGGWQLPYVETALPDLVFLAGEPPPADERDRLLLAMARLSPALRAEVEAVAARKGVPLAPLYAAWLAMGTEDTPPEDLRALLERAAGDYLAFRDDLARIDASDAKIAALQAQALEAYALGAMETAEAKIAEAKRLGEAALHESRERFAADVAAQAQTLLLAARLAEARGNWDAAVADLTAAADLVVANGDGTLPPEVRRLGALARGEAGLLLERMGRLAEAEERLWQARQTYAELTANPGADWSLRLEAFEAELAAHLLFADAMDYQTTRPVTPLEVLETRLEDLTRSATDDPDSSLRLGMAWTRLSDAYVEEDEIHEGTIAALERAGDLMVLALEGAPDNPRMQLEMARWLWEAAYVSGDEGTTVEMYQTALSLLRPLTAPPAYPGAEQLAAQIMLWLAWFAPPQETRALLQEAQALLLRMVEEGRASPDAQSILEAIASELQIVDELLMTLEPSEEAAP